jgi:hypothetical protein
MDRDRILAAAQAAEPRARLEEHREAVQTLRDKGFTWRDIAEFLTEQGVQTDHTRVYRTFGQPSKHRRTESRPLEISRITYLGERKTKKGKTWNVMEIELPSKLGQPITVVGHTWGSGAAKLALRDEDSVAFRDASLVIKTGGRSGFPMAFIKAEFQAEGDYWSAQEVYIMPKWEALL